MSVLVSVIVPTYRRPHMLEHCLQALLEQNFPTNSYEIIVVEDDPGETPTRKLVANIQQNLKQQCESQSVVQDAVTIAVTGFSPQITTEFSNKTVSQNCLSPRLVYLQVAKNLGPAGARNLGWKAAAGEIIAFTDDDCLPQQDWLANGFLAFEPNTAAVSGRVIVPLPPCPTDNELNTTGLERSDFVTANCFYRKSILETFGGFDERFRMAWREDSDLYFQLCAKQLPLAWSQDAIVVHPVRPEAWGTSLRQQRKSFYNALLYKKHPHFYRQFIQKSPPRQYYAILISFLLLLLGAAVNQIGLATVALVFYFSMIFRFTMQRLKNTSHAPEHIIEMGLTSLLIPFLSIYWRLRGAYHWKVFFL
jgi:glycosyltransferase involved in cell wall biosynthesis